MLDDDPEIIELTLRGRTVGIDCALALFARAIQGTLSYDFLSTRAKRVLPARPGYLEIGVMSIVGLLFVLGFIWDRVQLAKEKRGGESPMRR